MIGGGRRERTAWTRVPISRIEDLSDAVLGAGLEAMQMSRAPVTGSLAFASGAVVSITVSFDVPGHRHLPIEIYGTEASLIVPDPNRFGGEVALLPKGGDWADVPVTLPWADGNHRSLGLADMAAALVEGRPHRASGELALHVLEVMEALGRSADTGRFVDVVTRPERPAPLAEDPPLDRS